MIKKCPRCGKSSSTDDDIKFCPHCGASYDTPEILKPEETKLESDCLQILATEESEPAFYAHWEDRGRYSFFEALFETWKECTFSPVKFYGRMPVSGGIGKPLLYAIIFIFIGIIFNTMYDQLFGLFINPETFFSQLPNYSQMDARLLEFRDQFRILSVVIAFTIMPVMLIVGCFISAGVFHLIMLIFGWQAYDFESTIRVVTYAKGPSFFAVIPIIGGLIGYFWEIVLIVIGLKEVNNLSYGQAIMVLIMPIVFACVCSCAVGAFLMLVGAH